MHRMAGGFKPQVSRRSSFENRSSCQVSQPVKLSGEPSFWKALKSGCSYSEHERQMMKLRLLTASQPGT